MYFKRSFFFLFFFCLTGTVYLQICWLVVLGLTAFETAFQSISSRLPKRGRQRRERIMSKQPPSAPSASAVGPCPTVSKLKDAPALEVYPAPSHHPTTPYLQIGFRNIRTDVTASASYPSSSRFLPGRVAQSVGHPTRKSGVLGSIPGLATYFRFSFRFFKKGSCQLLAKVCARSTG